MSSGALCGFEGVEGKEQVLKWDNFGLVLYLEFGEGNSDVSIGISGTGPGSSSLD